LKRFQDRSEGKGGVSIYRVIEVAKMLNVSKVTVYKKMSLLKKELAPFLIDEKHITYIKPEGLELLKDALAHGKEMAVIPEIEVLKLQEIIRLQDHELGVLRRESHYWMQTLMTDLKHFHDYLEQVLRVKQAILNNRLKTIESLKAQLVLVHKE